MTDRTDFSRLHAFDNARAVMMWLGIVLHVSVNHLTFPSPIPWKDAQTSGLADLLFLVIHSFRMPVFFLLSGFLAAMMVSTRGPRVMLNNRMRRLALPFVVFWPLMLVGMGMLALKFIALAHPGAAPLDLAAQRPAGMEVGPMHMWFIYYLLIYSVAAAALSSAAVPQAVKRAWNAAWTVLVSHWWTIPVLAIPLGVAGAFAHGGMVAPNRNFVPNMAALLFYAVFFTFGWTMFALRAAFVDRLRRFYGAYLIAGTAAFFLMLAMLGQNQLKGGMTPHVGYAVGLAALLLSLGVIGLFVRFLPHENRVLRYVADSSYWVFLVHMLGTMGFGVLLYHAPLGAPAKMAINILATTAVCLLSYHFLVRNTWVGALLGGRRNGVPAPAAPVSAAP